MTSPAKVNESHISKFDAGSGYLRSTDLLVDGVFRQVTLTIAEFFEAGTLQSADKTLIKQPVIGFTQTKKRLIMNKTNQEMLHMVSGTGDGAKTIGRRIVIEARKVDGFGDDNMLGIRIIPPPKMPIRKGLKKRLGEKVVWAGGELPKNLKEESHDEAPRDAEKDAD